MLVSNIQLIVERIEVLKYRIANEQTQPGDPALIPPQNLIFSEEMWENLDIPSRREAWYSYLTRGGKLPDDEVMKRIPSLERNYIRKLSLHRICKSFTKYRDFFWPIFKGKFNPYLFMAVNERLIKNYIAEHWVNFDEKLGKEYYVTFVKQRRLAAISMLRQRWAKYQTFVRQNGFPPISDSIAAVAIGDKTTEMENVRKVYRNQEQAHSYEAQVH
jgi:hypothetical protein